MSCSLAPVETKEPLQGGTLGTALAGTLVSSLHRLKDLDNTDGAFFVFGDLSVKVEGTFRLQFNLYEMRKMECFYIRSVQSDPFPVLVGKAWPGMQESTPLTRSFSDQGVRLRLRKEPRSLLRKRGPAMDDYEPRHYRTGNRQGSQTLERQPTGTSIESQDSKRQSQIESAETSDPHTHPSYDQRQQMARYSSQPSAGSYPGPSVPYDESSKRPRTGSEQSSSQQLSYNQQNQALESPQYQHQQRPFQDPQQTFSSYSPQQPPQGFPSYYQAQPPQSSGRPEYYNRIYGSEHASPQTLDPRSPQVTQFSPQAQAVHYQQSPQQHEQYGTPNLAVPSPVIRAESGQGSYQMLNLVSRPSSMVGMGGMGMSNMGPPTYGRMNTNLTFSPVSSSGSGRRDSYASYQTQNPNMSPANLDVYATRGPSVASTTAPEGTF
jgi:Velvet factor